MFTASHNSMAGNFPYRFLLLSIFIVVTFVVQTQAARIDNSFVPAIGAVDSPIPRATLTFQSDGKILAVGSFDFINGKISLKIVRLNPDLSIDNSFYCAICNGADVGKVIIQSDGKYLVPIRSKVDDRMKLFRLFSDGSLDSSFVSPFTMSGDSTEPAALLTDGSGRMMVIVTLSAPGTVTQKLYRLSSTGAIDNTFTPLVTNGTPDQAFADVQVLPDQKLMVCGSHAYGVLFRVNTDGTKDFTFSSPSITNVLSLNSKITQFIIDPDGRICFTGLFDEVNGVTRKGLARINIDQGVDMGFNPSLPLVPTTYATGIFRQSDGNYIVSGSYSDGRKFIRLTSTGSIDGTYNSPADLRDSVYWILDSQDRVIFNGEYNNELSRMSRLTVTGARDPGFRINLGYGGQIAALATGPDGRVVISGHFSYVDNSEVAPTVRLNGDGSLDPTFNVARSLDYDIGRKLLVQPDGRVIGMYQIQGTVPTVKVIRFELNGAVDPTFDLTIQRGQTMLLQPDGKLLVGGGAMTLAGFARTGVLRINQNGSLDTAFNPGIATPNIMGLALEPGGKIVIGGGFTSIDGINKTNFARLNANGTIDQSFTGGSATRVSNIVRLPNGSFIVSATVNVVRYTSAGALDPTYQTTVFNPVDTIDDFTIRSMVALPNGSVMVGGSFDSPAPNIVLLRTDGSPDTSFVDHGANGRVDSLDILGSRVVAGGTFRQIGGVSRLGIGAISFGTPSFDFDGDGRTDIGIYRPGAGEWWVNRSSTGQTFALQFGASTDRITPADYTGDGKADIAFFRPSSGEWYVLRSEDFSFFALPFGTNGDFPVPADYDADGKADFAIFRPSSSTWFVSQSSGAPTRIVQFGVTGDQPVVADYDADGKADIGIFRPGPAEWWINRSTAGLMAVQFGASADKAVQGDYTGDGKADVAIWRPSTGEWFIVRSEDSSFYGFPFGASSDTPAPGDYDGDGKFDATVFRPSSATWFIARSTAGTQIVQFGATGDRPIPNAFVP